MLYTWDGHKIALQPALLNFFGEQGEPFGRFSVWLGVSLGTTLSQNDSYAPAWLQASGHGFHNQHTPCPALHGSHCRGLNGSIPFQFPFSIALFLEISCLWPRAWAEIHEKPKQWFELEMLVGWMGEGPWVPDMRLTIEFTWKKKGMVRNYHLE